MWGLLGGHLCTPEPDACEQADAFKELWHDQLCRAWMHADPLVRNVCACRQYDGGHLQLQPAAASHIQHHRASNQAGHKPKPLLC